MCGAAPPAVFVAAVAVTAALPPVVGSENVPVAEAAPDAPVEEEEEEEAALRTTLANAVIAMSIAFLRSYRLMDSSTAGDAFGAVYLQAETAITEGEWWSSLSHAAAAAAAAGGRGPAAHDAGCGPVALRSWHALGGPVDLDAGVEDGWLDVL